MALYIVEYLAAQLRNRRAWVVIAIAFLLLMVRFFMLGTKSAAVTESHMMAQDQHACLKTHLHWWDGQLKSELVLMSADPNDDAPTLPYIGNGFIGAQVGVPEVTVKSRGATTTLPWINAVQLSDAVDDVLSVLDVTSGILRRLSQLSSRNDHPNSCQVVEELWYAHRAIPTLLVHQVTFHNTLTSPEVLHFKPLTSDDTIAKLPKLTFDTGFDMAGIDACIKQTSQNSFALLIATTPLSTATVPGIFTVPFLSLFSASLYGDVDMTGLVVNGAVNSSMFTEGVRSRILSELTAFKDHISTFEKVDTELLLEEHEVAWNGMFSLANIDARAPGETLHPIIGSALYYIASYFPQSSSTLYRPAPPKIDCYSGPSVLVPELWKFPATMELLALFIESMTKALSGGGCNVWGVDDVTVVETIMLALVQSLSGVRLLKNGLVIHPPHNPAFKLHEVSATGIRFGKHLLSVKFDSNHITVSRMDSLSEPVYVMDSSHESVILGIKQAFLFADDVVYLSNSRDRVIAIRDQFQELHEAIPRVRGKEPARPWSKWVIIVGVSGVVLFHCILGRIIYTEVMKPTANEFKTLQP